MIEMGKAGVRTMQYVVEGPGGKWSVWDHGDELTVTRGTKLTNDVVARVPQAIARKMDDGHRRQHVEDAAGAIHVAKLLGSDHPVFHLLWR